MISSFGLESSACKLVSVSFELRVVVEGGLFEEFNASLMAILSFCIDFVNICHQGFVLGLKVGPVSARRFKAFNPSL